MATNSELVRCTLGNGWDIVADYVPGAERVELTLQALNDRNIRVLLNTDEVKVLMQMRDDARKDE